MNDGKGILKALDKEIGATGALSMARAKKVQLEFFMGLGQPAFSRQAPVLKYFKKYVAPRVGLIRVKPDGSCRMRYNPGGLDEKACKPGVIEVPLKSGG
jgi:hypothetical protein